MWCRSRSVFADPFVIFIFHVINSRVFCIAIIRGKGVILKCSTERIAMWLEILRWWTCLIDDATGEGKGDLYKNFVTEVSKGSEGIEQNFLMERRLPQ